MASERPNGCVGRIAGLLILRPFTWFRHLPFARHRWTEDPELEGGKPETPPAYALHVSGRPCWSAHARNLAGRAFGTPRGAHLPAHALPRIRVGARVMLAAYGLAAASLAATPLLLTTWLVPVVVGLSALRLHVLAEPDRYAFVAGMFGNTRTSLTNRLPRALAWNMPYHAEHHAFPDVAFHRLPELHARATPHLGVVEKGHRRVHSSDLAARLTPGCPRGRTHRGGRRAPARARGRDRRRRRGAVHAPG